MFPPRGTPADLDAETYRRVARTFFVFRMVKGSLLLVFLAVVLVVVLVQDWPTSVAVGVAAAMLGMATFLSATWRRYAARG